MPFYLEWKEPVCGAVAGVIARTATCPIDVLKIRLQIQPELRSPWSALKGILSAEGLGGLWKGNVAGVLLYASYNATQFFVYERLRGQSVFSPVAQTGTAAESFLKGATAAAGATTLTYPFDLLRTRMVLLSSSHLSLLSVLRNIIAKEGPLGLFKGYSLTVSQVLPYMGAIFAVHDTALQSIKARALFRGKEELVAGGTAGLLCKTCFMPIDVLRRRFQILRATGTASASVYQNHTYLLSKSKTALIRHMWQHEGIRGFFRGWSMAVVKTTPTTAITFFIYNYLMRSL